MSVLTELLFIAGFNATPSALAAVTGEPAAANTSPKEVVQEFLNQVRSGKAPDKASRYLASTVLAHQMNSDNETTVIRNPEDYVAHVKEFKHIYGDFDFEVTQLLADGEHVLRPVETDWLPYRRSRWCSAQWIADH